MSSFSSMSESFELEIEIPFPSALKHDQKESVINSLHSQMIKNGATSANLKETFYVEKRSAEALETIHFVFEVVSPYAGIAGLIIAVFTLINKKKSIY